MQAHELGLVFSAFLPFSLSLFPLSLSLTLFLSLSMCVSLSTLLHAQKQELVGVVNYLPRNGVGRIRL